jgi:hypothetical protein
VRKERFDSRHPWRSPFGRLRRPNRQSCRFVDHSAISPYVLSGIPPRSDGTAMLLIAVATVKTCGTLPNCGSPPQRAIVKSIARWGGLPQPGRVPTAEFKFSITRRRRLFLPVRQLSRSGSSRRSLHGARVIVISLPTMTVSPARRVRISMTSYSCLAGFLPRSFTRRFS